MPGLVERRTQQLGHTGVDDRHPLTAGRGLMEQHARDQLPALPDDRAAELEMDLDAGSQVQVFMEVRLLPVVHQRK